MRPLRPPSTARRLTNVGGRTRNLERRFLPTGDGCNAWQDFDDLDDDPAIGIITPTGCSADVSDPAANITGRVWTPCATIEDSIGILAGHIRAVLTDPGSSAPGTCDDSDYFNYYYLTPPWDLDPHAPPAHVPFAYGITYDEDTRTAIPAWLIFDATNSNGFAILVPGTELANVPDGTPADGWNFARPDYPFDYESGDTLFEGSFLYLPTIFG